MAYAKSVKVSPPSVQFSLIVGWPYRVTPLFHVSFSQTFHFCHYILVKLFQAFVPVLNLDGVEYIAKLKSLFWNISKNIS